MYNKLHDGPPPYLPLGPRQADPPPRPRSATIAALSWAAEQAGQSYGQFIIGLTAADHLRIQEEYDKHQAEQRLAKAERMAAKKRVDTTPPGPDLTFIINDNDL